MCYISTVIDGEHEEVKERLVPGSTHLLYSRSECASPASRAETDIQSAKEI